MKLIEQLISCIMPQKRGRFRSVFSANILFVLVFALVIGSACGEEAPESSAAIEGEDVSAEFSQIESTSNLVNEEVLGEITLEYPASLQVKNNGTVQISVRHILDLFAEASSDFDVIDVAEKDSLDAILIDDNTALYSANIFITSRMKVEVESATMKVEPIRDGYRPVSFADPSRETFWAFQIIAPDHIGPQQFVVKVFQDRNDQQDSWSRSVTIDIVAATAPPPSTTAPESAPSGLGITLGIVVALVIAGAGGWYFFTQRNESSGGDKGISDLKINRKNIKLGEKADEIQDILIDTFNQDELRNLCDDFGLRFEDLGDTITVQTIKLVDFFARRNELEELLAYIKEERPNVPLPFDAPSDKPESE